MMKNDYQPFLSVVSPCYNEAGNIPELYSRITKTLKDIGYQYEIIFINNGSFDNSEAVFREITMKDDSVMVISLTRNFGSQNAYTCGLNYAHGDGVICMDGDLQDPPELIPQMISKWREGFDVVYGIRVKRIGSIIRRIGYKLFYRLFKQMAYIDVPLDAGDFALLDRRVVDAMNLLPERNRFLRGLRAWVGFKQTGVEYTRLDRFTGKTSNSFLDNVRWASMGIFSFSYKPLEMISTMAFATVGLAIIGMVVYLILYFVSPVRPPGFSTLILSILFLGAMQLISMAIIGQYLGKMFEEIKARPIYLVDKILSKETMDNHIIINKKEEDEEVAFENIK